jgi:hypothetical protein
MHPFGKDFTRWYFPLVNDTTPDSLLTSQSPTIYIYENQPSRGQGATLAVQTITSWTWDAGKNGWYYTISAIDDPQPTSMEGVEIFWESVNFRLQAAKQIQEDIRALEMERVSGHSQSAAVTDDTLRSYFPQLDSCSTEAQRLLYTTLAIDDIKAKLKAKGYEWARLTRPDRLAIAVAYRILWQIMLVQIQQGSDKYAVKYQEFKGLFESTMEALAMEYDSDNDGLVDTKVNVGSAEILLIR